MTIEFSYPFYSLLFLFVGFVGYYFYTKSTLPTSKKLQLLIIRSIIFTFIILALMDTQAIFTTKHSHFVFLVDQSKSIESKEADLVSQINQLKNEIGEEDIYSVITYSQEVAVELLRAKKEQDFLEFKQTLDGNETNLEKALRFGQQLIQSSFYNGKIILLTDGNETTGNWMDALGLLEKTNIAVDVIALATNEKEDVSIIDLKASNVLYEHETVHLDAIIASSTDTNAILDWKVNQQVIASTNVSLQKGNNTFRYSYDLKETGFIHFTVEVQASKDAFKENNRFSTVSIIKSTPKILVVYEEENFLSNYLTDSEYLVDFIHVNHLPTTLSSFLQYKSMIFENTSGVAISSNQMDLIHQAVHDYGVGFIMTGGENSFGLGGYFQTPIERLLPVDMDISGQKELPSLGLVILVDRSGSMGGGKLELAKEAAIRSVEMLREEDTFGFIAFDDQPWQIVKTNTIVDKDKIISDISSVSLGGGTDFQESLSMAVNQLSSIDVQRKHIILLTDGQAPINRISSIIQQAKNNNISLSTVAIGMDADQQLLNKLANDANGRYYFVQDFSVLPTILSRETTMMTRTYIEDNPFYPTLVGSSFINHLVTSGMPQMNAYIATSLKQGAKLHLQSEKEDPIFTSWQYGLGTTIAFTSDMTGKWSGDWAKWNQWQRFLQQMIQSSFLKIETEDLATSFKRQGNEQLISIQTNTSLFANVEASLVSDNGMKLDIHPIIKDTGSYEISIPSKEGMYYLNVTETFVDGSRKNYLTGFTIPYSKEYTPTPINWDALEMMYLTTGGTLIESDQSFIPKSYQTKRILQPLTGPFLLLAFLLFFAEIVMRRFQWFIPSITIANSKEKNKKTDAVVKPVFNKEVSKGINEVEDKKEPKVKEKSKEEKLNDLLNATKRKK